MILWPDTWNNHFHPTTAPSRGGSPRGRGVSGHDSGRSSFAAGGRSTTTACWARQDDAAPTSCEALRPQIREGICVVGLEPSCVSVFRDEMINLLRPDEDAKRLKAQTYLLSGFLGEASAGLSATALHRKALVQEHCHQNRFWT